MIKKRDDFGSKYVENGRRRNVRDSDNEIYETRTQHGCRYLILFGIEVRIRDAHAVVIGPDGLRNGEVGWRAVVLLAGVGLLGERQVVGQQREQPDRGAAEDRRRPIGAAVNSTRARARCSCRPDDDFGRRTDKPAYAYRRVLEPGACTNMTIIIIRIILLRNVRSGRGRAARSSRRKRNRKHTVLCVRKPINTRSIRIYLTFSKRV